MTFFDKNDAPLASVDLLARSAAGSRYWPAFVRECTAAGVEPDHVAFWDWLRQPDADAAEPAVSSGDAWSTLIDKFNARNSTE